MDDDVSDMLQHNINRSRIGGSSSSRVDSDMSSPIAKRHGGGRSVTSAASLLDDPCAEAFANMLGPRACQILIYEFLAFVWNDIVNQRLQRYGTFAILPGDLVKRRTPG
uniref:Uncharacterized protein n=1 Tax=Lygus hesperus TaxID=30085 RepID=A0A146KYE5_LYGHE